MLFYARKVIQQIRAGLRVSFFTFLLWGSFLALYLLTIAGVPAPQWCCEREKLLRVLLSTTGEKKIEIYYEAHTIMEKLSKHSQRWLIGGRAWDCPTSMGLSSGAVLWGLARGVRFEGDVMNVKRTYIEIEVENFTNPLAYLVLQIYHQSVFLNKFSEFSENLEF